jgi:hypothetical protein
MVAGEYKLSRRALLGAVCVAPLAGGAALADGITPRHPGLDPGPMNTSVRDLPRPCSWVADQARNDGRLAVAKWQKALTRHRRAEAALDDAAGAPDPVYDRLGDRHDAALKRLLRTPAPGLSALAAKLGLAVRHQAWELTDGDSCMDALHNDACRLAAASA